MDYFVNSWFISCNNKVCTIPRDAVLPLGITPLGNKIVPGKVRKDRPGKGYYAEMYTNTNSIDRPGKCMDD
jgi:hypothetical protein